MKFISSHLEEQVCQIEQGNHQHIPDLKKFAEELIISQVKAITYSLLKTLVLSGWQIPTEYMWYLFMQEENEICPIPDNNNQKFQQFCLYAKKKIISSPVVMYEDLFSTSENAPLIRIIGGYLYFADEGRINEFLAGYHSYLRLYIPSNRKYRNKRLNEILDLDDDQTYSSGQKRLGSVFGNDKPEVDYILAYTYPISSFGGVRLFIFLKEEALCPLWSQNDEGCTKEDAIYIRQTILYKELADGGIDFAAIKSLGSTMDKVTEDELDGCLLSPMKGIPEYESYRESIYARTLSVLAHEYSHVQNSGLMGRPVSPLNVSDDKYTSSYYTLRKDILFYLYQKRNTITLKSIFEPFMEGYFKNLGCGSNDRISFTFESVINDFKNDNIIMEDKEGYITRTNWWEGNTYAI